MRRETHTFTCMNTHCSTLSPHRITKGECIPPSNRHFSSERLQTWRTVLVCVLALVLVVRTVAYNYDFSLSLKDNAHNYNPFHKPVKSQPIKEKMPRALACITISMAQSHHHIRHDAPLSRILTLHFDITPNIPLVAVQEQSLRLAFFNTPPPDLCVLNAVFRI